MDRQEEVIKLVDMNLAREVKELRESGKLNEDPKNILKSMELMKQASAEIDSLKEELEDMDQIVSQFVISDPNFKYWLKAGKGIFEFGEGETDDPSFTMKTTWKTLSGMLSGEVDGTAAYMSGDLQIEGNLQDVMGYGELLRLAGEELQKLDEE